LISWASVFHFPDAAQRREPAAPDFEDVNVPAIGQQRKVETAIFPRYTISTASFNVTGSSSPMVIRSVVENNRHSVGNDLAQLAPIIQIEAIASVRRIAFIKEDALASR
jgi:hypothetical protein